MKIKAESLCADQFLGYNCVPWYRCSNNPALLVTSFHSLHGICSVQPFDSENLLLNFAAHDSKFVTHPSIWVLTCNIQNQIGFQLSERFSAMQVSPTSEAALCSWKDNRGCFVEVLIVSHNSSTNQQYYNKRETEKIMSERCKFTIQSVTVTALLSSRRD